MKILACGPYIGDFEQEIITFRPYCRWLSEVVDYDKIYLNTHFNRFFLYHFIPEENKINVPSALTRNELGQKGYIHNKSPQRDYNLFIRLFKDEIVEKEGCSKRDIDLYNISYLKSQPAYPIHNKIFDPINVPDFYDYFGDLSDKILFIPSKEEKCDKLLDIYEFLSEKYEIIVAGDLKCHIIPSNIVLSKPDWPRNGFKYILYLINNCKAVICPISLWTTICNLQKVNVFSWGPVVSQHKENGIYNLGNKNISTVPLTRNNYNTKIIKEAIEYFINKTS